MSVSKFTKLIMICQAKGWLLLGQRRQAMALFGSILESRPDDLLALNSLGYEALSVKNPGLAIDYFQKVVALTPGNSNSHFNLAFVLEELGRLDAAEASFRAAIAIEEKMDRAWYGLGITLVRQYRLDEALVALKKATALQPMSPFGWYQLARVHLELEQPEEARAVIRYLRGFEPKVAAQLERESNLQVVCK